MKFFLSHSSNDKFYVRYIADKLGDRAVFDEYSFESGIETLEEIFRTLGETDIFVLFVSETSLESDWVKTEITHGKFLLDNGQIKRFLPILIDRALTHSDSRIPHWIRDRYNLRLVAKPSAALRRIAAVFSQLSIDRHPALASKAKLFVGRNDELAQLERRIDDYTRSVPSVIIASGIREVGRKTFILNGLRKANKITDAYLPIIISLQPEDGIEGFISKLHDIGYYPDDIDIDSLSSISLSKKKDLLAKLLSELPRQNEVVLVDDWRSIVRPGGAVSEWFLDVVDMIPENRIVLAVAAGYRPKVPRKYSEGGIFAITIPELGPDERMGLLVRYLREVEGKYDIQPAQYEAFRGILNGYPEQAIFAGQLIAADGLAGALARSSELVEFAALKASVYVERYASDEKRSRYLEFLSWFEFVSLDLVRRIGGFIDDNLFIYTNELVNESICDLIGSSGEYVRLNDIIRDYVSRGSIRIPEEYAKAIASISRELFQNDDFSDYDYSEKFAAAKVALLDGSPVPEKLLIPAHFLEAIAHKYKTRQFPDVISLSERILKKKNYEEYIESQVRHYYCMALARMRDSRLLQEVQNIKGDEHNYVLAFYYRVMGRYEDALRRYQQITEPRWEENSKREMVLIYNVTENYDAAYKFARDGFRKYPSDAIVAQAYFEVLLHMPRDAEVMAELNACLASVERTVGERAEEIALCMSARYILQVEGNAQRALDVLDDGIARFGRSAYPALSKLEVGVTLRDSGIIDDALRALRKRDLGLGKVQIIKAEIMQAALSGRKGPAIARIDKDLSFIHPAARDRFRARIVSL